MAAQYFVAVLGGIALAVVSLSIFSGQLMAPSDRGSGAAEPPRPRSLAAPWHRLASSPTGAIRCTASVASSAHFMAMDDKLQRILRLLESNERTPFVSRFPPHASRTGRLGRVASRLVVRRALLAGQSGIKDAVDVSRETDAQLEVSLYPACADAHGVERRL